MKMNFSSLGYLDSLWGWSVQVILLEEWRKNLEILSYCGVWLMKTISWQKWLKKLKRSKHCEWYWSLDIQLISKKRECWTVNTWLHLCFKVWWNKITRWSLLDAFHRETKKNIFTIEIKMSAALKAHWLITKEKSLYSFKLKKKGGNTSRHKWKFQPFLHNNQITLFLSTIPFPTSFSK